MKTPGIIVITTLIVTIVTAPVQSEAIQILRTGLYHGEEVSAEAGPDWWGIFPEGNGYTLQVAPVTMTLAHDVIMDPEGEMTGKHVTIPQEATPILLIRGLDNPVQGPIPAVKLTLPASYLYPGQSCYLAIPGAERRDHIKVVALGTAGDQPDISDVIFYDYQFRLYQDRGKVTITQPLTTISKIIGEGTPRLVWAGDLDRDGKLDLLCDLSDHYNVRHLTLFLSSAAKRGELVGKVAAWRTTGC